MSGSFYTIKRKFQVSKNGVTTHIKRGEERAPPWAAPLLGVAALLSYIWWCGAPLKVAHSLAPSLFPLLHRKRHGLGEALQKYYLHHHHQVVVLLGVPGGSSTSVAPLERGIGGRHRSVCVTE